jgi:hypothetical protein
MKPENCKKYLKEQNHLFETLSHLVTWEAAAFDSADSADVFICSMAREISCTSSTCRCFPSLYSGGVLSMELETSASADNMLPSRCDNNPSICSHRFCNQMQCKVGNFERNLGFEGKSCMRRICPYLVQIKSAMGRHWSRGCHFETDLNRETIRNLWSDCGFPSPVTPVNHGAVKAGANVLSRTRF